MPRVAFRHLKLIRLASDVNDCVFNRDMAAKRLQEEERRVVEARAALIRAQQEVDPVVEEFAIKVVRR